jgi:hypothetical protein
MDELTRRSDRCVSLGIDALLGSWLPAVVFRALLDHDGVQAWDRVERGPTTLMFTAFNIGLGVVLVLLPGYASEVLDSGAGAYGALAAAFAAGELAGALVTSALSFRLSVMWRIAGAQALSGGAILVLALQPGLIPAMVALAAAGLFSAPMTIWAQSLRMDLTPPELRGHLFALLRTTMQAGPPAGGALGGPLVTAGVALPAAVGGLACGAPALLALTVTTQGRAL